MHLNDILIIADFESNGGTKTYFSNLINYFNNKPIKNKYVYLKKNSSLTNTELLELRKNYIIKYFPDIYTHNNSVKYPLFFILYRFAFCLFVSLKYKHVIVSTGNYFHFLVFGIFCRNRFYYILHTYPEDSVKKNTFNLSSFIKIIYFKFLNLCNFSIITVSKFARQQIIKNTNLSRIKIHVIYNFTEIILDNKIIEDINIIDNKNINILTVGHVEKWKNPEYWLSIAIVMCEKRKNVFFKWVGSGSLREKMILMTPLDFRKNIQWVDETIEVNNYYKNSTIYFQPSLIESFGLSVIEAMSFGLPCIVSNKGGLTEIIKDNINGFVVNLDDNQTTFNKFNELIDNYSLRMRLRQKAIDTVNTFFTKKNWESKMNKIFNCE
jgi:glycosyltransferase involved in cell wall biosynthesis